MIRSAETMAVRIRRTRTWRRSRPTHVRGKRCIEKRFTARTDREQHRQDLLATQHSLRSSEEARDQAEKQARQNQQGWDETQQRWQETQGELSLAREQLAAALADKAQLQARLDRFEIHPLIGPALRGRRHLVRAVDSFRSREAV